MQKSNCPLCKLHLYVFLSTFRSGHGASQLLSPTNLWRGLHLSQRAAMHGSPNKSDHTSHGFLLRRVLRQAMPQICQSFSPNMRLSYRVSPSPNITPMYTIAVTKLWASLQLRPTNVGYSLFVGAFNCVHIKTELSGLSLGRTEKPL